MSASVAPSSCGAMASADCGATVATNPAGATTFARSTSECLGFTWARDWNAATRRQTDTERRTRTTRTVLLMNTTLLLRSNGAGTVGLVSSGTTGRARYNTRAN